MGESTTIAWTDHTFQPWMGCTRVSPGCDHCYAEALGKRTGRVQWGDDAERVPMSEAYWRNPVKWNRQAEVEGRRHRVFCASMADVFEDRDGLADDRERLFELMCETPWLDWQLLTKRPQNVLDMVPSDWLDGVEEWSGIWPPNVWVGTTVEDQERAIERVPLLVKIPAAVRFLSCEPLIGPVVLDRRWLAPEAIICGRGKTMSGESRDALAQVIRLAGAKMGWRGVDWVIVGGESGAGARPMDSWWARQIVDQCTDAGVPVFFKQAGKVLGREWGCPDSHGADWTQWPEWARRREFPTVVAS